MEIPMEMTPATHLQNWAKPAQNATMEQMTEEENVRQAKSSSEAVRKSCVYGRKKDLTVKQFLSSCLCLKIIYNKHTGAENH